MVSGYQSSVIFEYKIEKDTFSATNYCFNSHSYNFVFKNWIVCFGNSLFEIEEGGNLIERQKIIEEGGFLNSNCSYIRQKYIYFILIGRKVYRINIESKSLESINTDYL